MECRGLEQKLAQDPGFDALTPEAPDPSDPEVQRRQQERQQLEQELQQKRQQIDRLVAEMQELQQELTGWGQRYLGEPVPQT